MRSLKTSGWSMQPQGLPIDDCTARWLHAVWLHGLPHRIKHSIADARSSYTKPHTCCVSTRQSCAASRRRALSAFSSWVVADTLVRCRFSSTSTHLRVISYGLIAVQRHSKAFRGYSLLPPRPAQWPQLLPPRPAQLASVISSMYAGGTGGRNKTYNACISQVFDRCVHAPLKQHRGHQDSEEGACAHHSCTPWQ